jgi:hypothetical protein
MGGGMSAYMAKLDEMVDGYRCGFDGAAQALPDCYRSKSAAWRHGWHNGLADRNGSVFEAASVLRRRAEMILGSAA